MELTSSQSTGSPTKHRKGQQRTETTTEDNKELTKHNKERQRTSN